MKTNRLVASLMELMAIPSVNPMGREVELGEIYGEKTIATRVAERLRALGLETVLHAHAPGRYSVVGRLDVGAEHTVVLDAHLDTVSHENMEVAPFVPLRKGGRIYGRGACDDKASLAVFIAAVEQLRERQISPVVNVVIAATGGEEFDFGGVREVVGSGLQADLAIVGEPTRLDVIHAHKGVQRCIIRSRGVSCHASAPEMGRNALYPLAQAALRCRDLHHDLQRREGHPELGHATLSAGRMAGGTEVNTVPASGFMELDRRLLPGERPEDAHAEICGAVAGIDDLIVEDPYMSAPALETPADAEICRVLQRASQSAGRTPRLVSAAYATNAPFYAAAGIPVAVFGPGDIAQAHTRNEYVEEAQLQMALEVIVGVLTAA